MWQKKISFASIHLLICLLIYYEMTAWMYLKKIPLKKYLQTLWSFEAPQVYTGSTGNVSHYAVFICIVYQSFKWFNLGSQCVICLEEASRCGIVGSMWERLGRAQPMNLILTRCDWLCQSRYLRDTEACSHTQYLWPHQLSVFIYICANKALCLFMCA